MRITWFGHAAFGIETHDDANHPVRIILDPYNYPECGGYLPIDEPADIVSVSHENRRYHSDVSSIRGEFELVDGLALAAGGARRVRGIPFEAIEVYENADGEGPNAMVKLRAEDLTVAHQGDLGHALRDGALDFLRDVDILLALTGGPPTIELDDLVTVIEVTSPGLVLPMHYKTPRVNLDLLPLERFLDLCGRWTIERPGRSTLEVTTGTLPETTTVVALEHAR